MPELIEIAKTSELAVGRVKAVLVAGRTIALSHTESGFHATDNVCPHRGGPLAEGDVIGEELTCPWHLWSFDVRTGRCPGNPEITVATHEVVVDGERVMMRLS